jgi:hypothetical protein
MEIYLTLLFKIREVRVEFNLQPFEKIGINQPGLAFFFGRDLFNFTKFLVLILKEESK